MKCINEGGFLWVNGFREIPKDNSNITVSDIFIDEDFISLEKYKLEYKISYEIDQKNS